MPLKDIVDAQSTWARRRWPGHRGRRAPSLPGNLLVPLTRTARLEFRSGKSGELGRPGSPGRMQSLLSSSALAYNFFGPWIGLDVPRAASALGCQVSDATIAFERTFPHGLGTVPPHMDITLDNHQARPLGIECKFTEPYRPGKHRPLADRYCSGSPGRWHELGLPRCEELARSIRHHNTFARLDAGQLLKHLLGLAYTTRQPPRLVCLWYDTRCTEAREFREELLRFQGAVDDSVAFRSVTYQDAFRALGGEGEPVRGYFAYLRSRYFPA